MRPPSSTKRSQWTLGIVCLTLTLFAPARAQEPDADELARKVSNPASFMISVPIHTDIDFGDGPEGKSRRVITDIEPVLPFRLTDDWNLISHTDIPFGYANPAGAGDGTFGLGDISQTLSFTPASHHGLIWAIGGQVSVPTATSHKLGTGQLSAGPSALLLSQSKALTLGLSASHLWSVAGKNDGANVSSTEVRPFLAWHLGGGRTISTNLDASYDWKAKEWDLPLDVSFSKVTKVGKQALSLSAGGKYWLDNPQGGSDWGIQIGVVLIFSQSVKK